MERSERTFDTPGLVCPVCHTELDAATNVEDDQAPKPGDVTICVYCATVMEFTEGGLRIMSQEELDAVHPETIRLVNEVAARCRKAKSKLIGHESRPA